MNSVFKALADPTRREILIMLQKDNLTAGEISENFNISKPSISHHLSLLKNADLIISERNGQRIYYSLNTTVFQDIVNWVLNFKKV
ncbi:winged helix-turn-helix transcriptional regulator [Halobacillus locisalis]|uniref:Winged helix-turn-helix transcriptional regulator n=1 Tax=Halobacillus locisalis TaxID=220753 RepID=A0A838CVP3_9BACI|nr:autorepressor SdpR family transcription factor [Halobacillus locisalis]MBA2175825.1 winged helix-turn-helix transcriptional regulator [Halobacillus locisalis]